MCHRDETNTGTNASSVYPVSGIQLLYLGPRETYCGSIFRIPALKLEMGVKKNRAQVQHDTCKEEEEEKEEYLYHSPLVIADGSE